MLFTTAQKVTKHLGYFCYKICCQEMPKIALSGHTGSDVNSGFFVALDLESYECEQPELTEEKERHKYLKWVNILRPIHTKCIWCVRLRQNCALPAGTSRKKRKSYNFFHRTCLPHPHAPHPRRVNGPLGFHLGHFTDTVTMHFGVRRSSRDLSILLLQNVYKTLRF